MLRHALLTASILGSIGCAAPPRDPASDGVGPRLDAIEKRLSELERRPAPAPSAAVASPAPATWSCAAKCVRNNSCIGTNDLGWRDLVGEGESAASAFRKLSSGCDNILYIEGRCSNGAFTSTEATLANACVRN